MIQIAGGVYLEHCLSPDWHALYGSGGRAAALLGAATDVELHTYVARGNLRSLEAQARSFGYGLHAKEAPVTVAFSYVHPLATPVITPAVHRIQQQPALRIDAEVIVRFGMLEADVVVKGGRVVYDPQSAFAPAPFGQNGSTADALAIVANASELRFMTGEADVATAAAALIRQGAEVVVAKQGPRGATVVTPGGEFAVPAFKGDTVFGIGSGDVFAAAFGLFWGEQRKPPEEAARLASRVTALYCRSRSLPPVEMDAGVIAAQALDEVTAERGKVYLAAPFFTLGQRWMVEEARTNLLAMGLQVFSPIHDVGPGGREVAAADLEGLAECDRVLALVDGGDVGTVFEVGFARARGLFVVALSEAQPITAEPLKMIDGSGCLVVDDFATAIYRVIWKS